MDLSTSDIECLKQEAGYYDYMWLTWSDIHGIARGKVVPRRHVPEVIDEGIGIMAGT